MTKNHAKIKSQINQSMTKEQEFYELIESYDLKEIDDKTLDVINFALEALEEQYQYFNARLTHQDQIEDTNSKQIAYLHSRTNEYVWERKQIIEKKEDLEQQIINLNKSRSEGGKHSHFRQYEKIIIDVLRTYHTARDFPRNKAIGVIRERIKESSGIDYTIASSTFNNWYRAYKENGETYIFKKSPTSS